MILYSSQFAGKGEKEVQRLISLKTGLFAKVKKKVPLDPTRAILVSFLAVILLGALLLCLPVSGRNGESTRFGDALFTSVSATCVTGLVVVDTYSHWSVFGRAVILCLIQVGGLGFMSIASLLSMLIGKRSSLRTKMVATQSLNLFDTSDIRRTVKHIFLGTAAFEGAAAFIFTVRFCSEYPFWSALGRGVFLSVSAFCNAGFDLCGDKNPFGSLCGYSGDPVINTVVMALIVIGGLGFFVWEEIYTKHRFSRFSLFTRVVLVTTLILIVGGAAGFFATEYSNPGTLGALSFPEKILASLFQSVSPRTAGFATVNLSGLRDVTKVLTIMLMFVGGSPGSTAGGVKTSTVAVLMIACVATLRDRRKVNIHGRRISEETVLKAFSLAVSVFFLIVAASFALSCIDSVPFIDAMFECTSAVCTVGSSIVGTSTLGPASKIILMILMYLGRVGLLSASFAVFNRPSDRTNSIGYPEARILIG